VERKGLGHPDTIFDALAEQISVSLCRYHIERFGLVLHHNVDKILLRGGSAQPAFGGGDVLEPLDLYLSGRAATDYDEKRIPVEDIAVQACRDWLGSHLPELDVERHVRIISRFRPGSGSLTQLFSERAGWTAL
jgi:S-adenosylmethionine synthetase